MKVLIVVLVVIAVIVVMFFFAGPIYILEEGYQCVIIQFGKINRTVTDAGLHFKIPFLETVHVFTKKILAWDGLETEIPTGEGENQFIIVDVTSRWRIDNIEKYYVTMIGDNPDDKEEDAWKKLDGIINDAVRTVISKYKLLEAIRNTNDLYERILKALEEEEEPDEVMGEEGLLFEEELLLEEETGFDRDKIDELRIEKGRSILSQEMQDIANNNMETEYEGEIINQYGIELIDIVIREIRYSDAILESVYKRMMTERQSEAEKKRSIGIGEKNRILGVMEREVNRILSEAYQKAEGRKGDADEEAARIYREAYLQNPAFFEFWRTLESYKKILPSFNKTLTTDADYFDFLYGSE
jgi:membrane protease subunit HflC